jgi:hypothetical protein
MTKKENKKSSLFIKFTPESQKSYEQSSKSFLDRINSLSPTELQKFDKNWELLEEIIKAYGEAMGVGNISNDPETGELTYENVEPSSKRLAELDKNPEAKKLIDILFNQPHE